MKVEEFDYYLPPELIAQEPVEPRDSSRLMVLYRNGDIEHRVFRDIVSYFEPGDCLVINDTRVIRARLSGYRRDTGGKVEILLLSEAAPGIWEVLVRPGRRARVGTELYFGGGELVARVLGKTQSGGRLVSFDSGGAPLQDMLERLGSIPLPPYIKAPLEQDERYQTVYAMRRGSVAAPTAGLHFTPELLDSIRSLGVRVVPVTLHIGLGTFRPVKVEEVEQHEMHEERYQLAPEAASAINEARSTGGRIFAVGTTCTRVLETCAGDGHVVPRTGSTRLFIYPGYHFKVVDALITNFHLPRSTLLMLVSAFAGRENILRAYNIAIQHRYRFYSFGDAMLIL
ncbi:MAG TPA: tRNA preQ1(34) S-adenosylmethionine ribosyltransferase-isomerase QueA [Firmicutes bacterium]|nr:tRNA preQ1(34) S-adenosylmethionine ribosyltransferase-isomerase QueA [Bacillota bacterium]